MVQCEGKIPKGQRLQSIGIQLEIGQEADLKRAGKTRLERTWIN